MVLIKIAQRCSSHDFESSKYIYASYQSDKSNDFQLIGYNYNNSKINSPDNITSDNICELLDKESSFTDENEENIIDYDDKLLNLFENNKIKNNTLYFLTLNDFINIHSINSKTILNCNKAIEDLKPLKNRIINKYWPQLRKLNPIDILGENDKKKEEYNTEKLKLKNYSFGNKLIFGCFENRNTKNILCDDIIVSYFRIIKTPENNNTINLYKLFANFKLSSTIPFMKWIGNTHDNKYYKIFKDSIIHDGHDILRNKDKTIDIHLCNEWTNDFYRSETKSLEDMNRYDILHKTDIILFKVALDDQSLYSTLVIHKNGTIEFIIKKNKNDLANISSKKQISLLLLKCNALIHLINNDNIYSDNNIIDFGDKKEINNIFKKETLDNKIDFFDCNLFFNIENYEVKNGISQKEYDKLKKNTGFNPLTPPFIQG